MNPLKLNILPQPDDTTCGPTCLHALYGYLEDDVSLEQVIREVQTLDAGGTLAVMMGNHALDRGYKVTLFTFNLMIFDPTWFQPQVDLAGRLKLRADASSSEKQRLAIKQYIRFLERGGRITLEDLTRSLLRHYLKRGIPIITGLNSTYLYRTMRVFEDTQDDDIHGEVVGHFVVLCGYDQDSHKVTVADPYAKNPYSNTHYYEADMDRLVCAILLGIMTYDGNLLIIEPSKTKAGINSI
ncbi:MAG: C39 family peptidase [Acidobacteria bacterium]|nr:C39 family peptidase [Acidobacteriota bacterium]